MTQSNESLSLSPPSNIKLSPSPPEPLTLAPRPPPGHPPRRRPPPQINVPQLLSPPQIMHSLPRVCARRRVHHVLARSKLKPDSVILNSLINLYSESNHWAEAERVFRDMGDKRDLVSWSSMISCYANSRMEFEAVDTFVRMLEDGFREGTKW
ncbi:hypothetical protein NL676_000348 [Syzygium grande]|nr:hypothetical protein NL676_000348 [Syzygium grande]